MPVFRQRKLIFVWVPKTGGTAFVDALGEHEATGHHRWDWYAEQFPVEWATYRRVGVVRHPVDRLRSCYFFARMAESRWHGDTDPHPDFELCRRYPLREIVLDDELWGSMRHAGWRPQSEWLGNPPRVTVYRFELLRLLPIARQNVTTVDDRAMGELPGRALTRLRERYADDFVLADSVKLRSLPSRRRPAGERTARLRVSA